MSLSKSIIRQYRVVTPKDLPDVQGPEEAEKQGLANGLANSLLEQARAEADRILAEAQQQVAAIVEALSAADPEHRADYAYRAAGRQRRQVASRGLRQGWRRGGP